jgi:hypothetical protein
VDVAGATGVEEVEAEGPAADSDKEEDVSAPDTCGLLENEVEMLLTSARALVRERGSFKTCLPLPLPLPFSAVRARDEKDVRRLFIMPDY